MKSLLEIRRQLVAGEFAFSRHALKRAVERNISEMEIREAGAEAEIIEDYPSDKYSPSGLLLGITVAGRPLHLQISFAESLETKIITLYEPNPNEWTDHQKRR